MRADWIVVEKKSTNPDQQGKPPTFNLLVLDPDYEYRALRTTVNSCRPLNFAKWCDRDDAYLVRKQPVFTLF
jgi:hypothetical protein